MSAPAIMTRAGSTGADWDNDNKTCNGWGQNANCTPKNHNTWNGCVTDRDQNYDTLNTAPTGGPSTRFYAEQYDACPAQLMPLSYDFAALKTKVDSLTPNGGTNQPIGIAWGWQSLTQSAPLNAPAEEANYTYKKVLIVMSDGLNTQDRWPSYGNGQTSIQWPDRRPPANPVRQHQGRRHRHLHDACEHRQRSDLRRSAILRQRRRQVLHRHLRDPDHGGLQQHRKLAVEVARRAIIARRNSWQVRQYEKSPAMTAGLFDILEDRAGLSAWRPG